MFTVVYILILCITTTINNKANEISDENTDSYKFDKKAALSILALFLVSIGLNFLKRLDTKIYLAALVIYGIFCLLCFLIINSLRIQNIKKEREQLVQMFEILDCLLKTKDSIDYNNVPFTINYDKGNKKQIDSIVVDMKNPDKFTDSALTQTVYNLNKFLPYRRWVSETDFPERTCTFIGTKLPPDLANFPGSDLRPWQWIPLGLGGQGEIGWNLGASKKEMGKSLYIYEDTGLPAQTTEIAKAPQALCVGSTGGGKAIFIDEFIKIKR